MSTSNDTGSEVGSVKFNLPEDIPSSCACRIGQIAADWGALEFQVNEAIWSLAGVYPALGACITAQIFTLDSRLNALLSLLKARQADAKLIERVNKFKERARGPADRRNRNIHDPWTVTSLNETARLEVTARGKLTFELVRVPDTELENDQKLIRKCTQDFNAICHDILAAIPTLPKIHLGELARIERDPPETQTNETK